jgi:alkylation response protein AidB-like acyl-CoA dehydrogenase
MTTAPDRAVSKDSVVQELTRFLAAELPGFRDRYGSRNTFETSLEWHRTLAAAGFVGLHWPVEYGGLGIDVATQVACESALSQAGAPPLAGFIGVNTVASAIMQWGTDEQKTALPRIRSGEQIFCQSFSEPGAGSDLASIRATLTRSDDGFVLNGQKVWTSHGLRGDYAFVLARSAPIGDSGRSNRGLSALLVPLDAPGVTRRPIRQLNGREEFAEIFFDDVLLDESALLGPLDEGWRVAMSALAHERAASLTLAARTCAAADTAIRARAKTVQARDRADLTDLYLRSEALRLLSERSLSELENGTPGPAQSVVKLAWSQFDQHFAELMFRLAGPGAPAGHEPELQEHLLFSRSSTIAAGTSEVMRTILAEQVLGLPR